MSTDFLWKPKIFNYELDSNRRRLGTMQLKGSDYHPLKPITISEATSVKVFHSGINYKKNIKNNRHGSELTDTIDPLSALAISNPLSDISSVDKGRSSSIKSEIYGEGFEPWSSRKLDILKNYTADEKLSVSMASIAKGSVKLGHNGQLIGNNVSNKLKERLGQLDDLEEGGFLGIQNLTQQEFVEKIHSLNITLTEAWNTNQKVKALKIAIQCAKLLGDVSVLQFYPSKYVLVSDLLHTFGDLVFERIFSMCPNMDREKIIPSEVPENAKEICLNWMLKIASIRELIPRAYIEAATLKCNQFIEESECNRVLVRLTNIARGVGDPLVSIYLRTFLCQAGVLHAPTFKAHLKQNFYDFLASYRQIHTNPVQNTMAAQKVTIEAYLSYFNPALSWILSCLAYAEHEAMLSDVLEKCSKTSNNLLLLNCCISAFRPGYVASRALLFCNFIQKSEDQLFPKFKVFQALGVKVAQSDPPENDRLQLLNDVWKFLIKIRDPVKYMSCATIWIEYVAKHFTKNEMNKVLGDIGKQLMPDRAFEEHYSEMEIIVEKVMANMTDISDVFSMEQFLPFIDMIQKEECKVKVCQTVASYFNKNQKKLLSDPIAISGLMYICKTLHDTINAIGLEDLRKTVSSLICGVISKVTFGKDFEQQLSFYVECRSVFRNLDEVLAMLVHAVNKLNAQVSKIVKGNHTKKTKEFVRACTAYSFITIPSLTDKNITFSLYLESGEVALISQCITQGDAMYKSAIGMLLELTKTTNNKTDAKKNAPFFISNFLSSLLTVPDNLEYGVLYLLKGLLNVVADTDTCLQPDEKCHIYIKVLSLLTAYSQDQYIYRIARVDSNEFLYSQDPKFLKEIENIGKTVLDEILSFLLSGENCGVKNRSECALSLFEVIISHSEILDDLMQNLAINMWNMASMHGMANMARILGQLKNRGGAYLALSKSLQLQSRA